MIYVRPKPKDHGKGRQIEGRFSKDDKIVLIDDLITTGGSVLNAVKATEKDGGNVIGVSSIFTYYLPDAKENFVEINQEQEVEVPGWTLLNTADIITTTETVTYELTVNGITITFSVETIKPIIISVTEKNMTHMGHDHSHGHGHGDSNNAGGGIIVSE